MTEAEFIKRIENALRTHKTPQTMAQGIYRICCAYCDANGMDPRIEVALRKPGQVRHHDHINCWSVAFEAGPHEWAVLAGLNTSNDHVLAEPYYSFDLCFYPARKMVFA